MTIRHEGRSLQVQSDKAKKSFRFKWRSQYNTDLRFSRGQISQNRGGNWETMWRDGSLSRLLVLELRYGLARHVPEGIGDTTS